VSITKNIITSTYIWVILLAFVYGPLVALHGWREWWVLVFYGVVTAGVVGGFLSHYGNVGRTSKSGPAAGPAHSAEG
jgi:hypothetical protein